MAERSEALEKALKPFEIYYDVNRETPEEPFAAEAAFHSHDEQYFLVRSARLGEAESNEYVFFAEVPRLDLPELMKLDAAAWEKGLARVKPHAEHRNTDIVLVVLSEEVAEEAFAAAKKQKHYKSYQMGFQGWTHYRLIVIETSSGRLTCNRQGRSMEKIFNKIYLKKKGEEK